MMNTLATLCTSLLFGGMSLFAFGFAAFLFTALPIETARQVIRKAFPWFYLFVIAVSSMAAALWALSEPPWALAMAAIALSTLPTRQILMPAINKATDAGLKQRFKVLHGLSVLITLGHIGASAWVLAQIA